MMSQRGSKQPEVQFCDMCRAWQDAYTHHRKCVECEKDHYICRDCYGKTKLLMRKNDAHHYVERVFEFCPTPENLLAHKLMGDCD